MAPRLLVVSLAFLLGSVSQASAQYATLDVTLVNASLVLACTETSACETVDDCDGLDCVDINADLALCLPPSRQVRYEVFCCQTLEDCPTRDGQSASSCVHVAGDIKVCAWPGAAASLYSLCASNSGGPTLETIAACFGGSGLDAFSLAAGDCDRDGIANASDSAPCSPDSVPLDGGVPHLDGDVNPVDFGVNEDGSDGEDGGPPTTDGVRFQGGGGCVVSASSGGTRHSALALGALLLGVALVRVTRRGR